MRKKLLHNWALKLASLFLAVVIWFLVVQINDPPDTKVYSNIPVKLINTELLKEQNKVYEVLDDTDVVNVTVRAPKSVFEVLRASDIVAEADVSKITDINTIAIEFSVQNVDGWDSVEGNHDVVRLNVEDKRTRWIKVVYNTIGEVAENYMIASAEPDQNIIEISGPKSVIDSVSHAGVEIDVEGATSNRSANVDITLYDDEGNVVNQDNIDKNVEYVRMEVEVLATKEVPIEVNYMGVPADGYVATGVVSSDPETVKIAGGTYTLSRISKISVPAERLNITGESSDMSDVIDIRDFLPDNVRLADGEFNGKITATVAIDPIVDKTLEIPIDNIIVINLPQGLSAQKPEGVGYVGLHVSGLAEYINPLHAAEIRGTVDVAAWMEEQELVELEAGSYLLPITFMLGDDVTTEDVGIRLSIMENL